MAKAVNSTPKNLRRYAVTGSIILALFASFSAFARKHNVQSDHVVWWGENVFLNEYRSGHTNGLAECGDEFITNAVAVAAGTGVGFALKHNGTVRAFGYSRPSVTDLPPNLSNVVSISVEDNACWAIKRDGTVARWGHMGDLEPDAGRVIPRLTNVVSIVSAGAWRYLALEKDGRVLGFELDNPEPLLPLVKAHGDILENVTELASMGDTPLVLKSDGIVYQLDYQIPGAHPVAPRFEVHNNVFYEYLGGESAKLPYQYTTIEPVMIGGQVLSNVTALASSDGHALALKKVGTVVSWGNNYDGDATVPGGLNNVIAIAAAGNQSMALRRDGTVVCWGNNYFGQSSVPTGLSNVVAIASSGSFNLAITTGNIPSSVFIQPHGRLEEMAQKADLIFKGQVVSSTEITNSSFNVSSLTVEATRFKIISVLKGEPLANVVFEHYEGFGKRGFIWDGPAPPLTYKFEDGQSYLVFAARMDGADTYYSPPKDGRNAPNTFRQIADVPKPGCDDALKTLDNRRLGRLSVKETYWLELNRLLKDSNPTNALYAIDALDHMSSRGEQYDEWFRSDDFRRAQVLSALLPLTRSKDPQVATHALNCFETGTDAPVLLAAFTNTLIKIANKGPTSTHRLAAIRALSGLADDSVSNSLAQLLRDKDENIRAGAVGLLPRFQPVFAAQALRAAATDSSPGVRAAVADTIGSAKMVNLIQTVEKLWSDTNNVHTSAGNALLNFDLDRTADFLKEHLAAQDFHARFLCKLAENDPQPWLTNLVEVLKAKREANWREAEASNPKDRTNYFQALMYLSGDEYKCWDIIYGYLDRLPKAAFEEQKLDWCMDVLEDAGNTGSREPVMLYELYKKNGLTERATKFRRENGKCSGFDVTFSFDKIDRQDPTE